MNITAHQIDIANSLKWFHALEFGEYQTVGRFAPHIPPNVTLFGVMDLLSGVDVTNMECLDVGPAHGLISFGLALKGANVTTINIGGGKPPQFSLGEEVYGVNIDYRHGVSLEDSTREFGPGKFDLIVAAGVMYHLLNPADIFFRLRPLLKRNGLLVIETVYAKEQEDPVLVLNSEMANTINQVTTYFLPSVSALEGLAKLASFEVLGTRSSEPSRFALIARATLPDNVPNRTDLCMKMHQFDFEDPLFSVKRLTEQISHSSITYTGRSGHHVIDTHTFIPDFPSHPKVMKNPIGNIYA